MKKRSFRLLSVLLAMILAASVAAPVFAAGEKEPGTAADYQTLHFDDSEKFRILHVTDSHLSVDDVADSTRLIAAACDREQPDLVVVTGDNAQDGTKEEILANIDALMNVFAARKIPVAVTFGNHDSERGIFTREELMAVYNTYPCSISVDDGPNLTGCGTYLVPIKSSDMSKTVFNVWVFDSGDYDDEHHYANVAEDQVEWYKRMSAQSEAENGGKVNSLAFQHIIVPQIYDAMTETSVWLPGSYKGIYRDKYYRLSPEYNTHNGVLAEYPCPGYYDHGQFDAITERGDVLGMFFGHDHSNAFEVNFRGVRLCATPATRFRANNPMYECGMGYRIIDLDESDTSTFQTRVVYWYDFFSASDAVRMLKANDTDGFKLVATIKACGIFRKFVNKFLMLIELV